MIATAEQHQKIENKGGGVSHTLALPFYIKKISQGKRKKL
jgi:hypothetical protein